MPNTAVKPANAESTWGEAPWEDRKPLILVKKALEFSSAFFVVRSSWLVGNEFVVRRGRPKGRPAVIFDHSPFGMMVRFYEPRATSHGFFADSDVAYRRDRLMIVLRPGVIRHKFRLYPRFTAGRLAQDVPYDIAYRRWK